MNFILFDPKTTKQNLLPLTYFRPISEIRCGILTLHKKWSLKLKTKISYLTDDYLQEKYPVTTTNDNVYINASIFPDDVLVAQILTLKSNEVLRKDNLIIAIRSILPLSLEQIEAFNGGDVVYDGAVETIKYTFDIFKKNGAQIKADFEVLTKGRKSSELSSTNTVIGKDAIFIEEGCTIEAVTFNTQEGPVYIGENATILEGSLIRGPFAMLENSVVKMGAKIYGGTTLGQATKVGGEVKDVVFIGNANKGHDGYLGDSVIGEWCNLGADTNNSNLKNNYSNVKLWNYEQNDFVDTNLQFCGMIMGDHSKSGIATMFNTGTVVGVNANIFGGDYQPKFFPSFKWGSNNYVNYRYDKALEVAKTVYKRRNIAFSDIEERLFKSVYELTNKYEKKINN